MSEQEKFLERWSRRKQEAAKEAAHTLKEELEQALNEAQKSDSVDKEAREGVKEASHPQPEEPAAFDLKTLPPLDSITATSDIRAFLAPGVPVELKLEALRRAWRSDPGIRDFIGLSENSWDFNDPKGAHGFGSLEVTEQIKSAVEAMLDRKFFPAESEPEMAETTRAAATEQIEKAADKAGDQISAIGEASPLAGGDDASQEVAVDKPKSGERTAKRSHGAALPK